MKYIITFAITSLTLFSLLYGLVISVDPYNKLGNNLFGFETKAVDFARQNKFNQIEYAQKKYEAFILGTSTAHRFESKELKNLTGLESYNYAVQSASAEDYLAITRHLLSKGSPKLIVLFPEFYGMNKNVATDDMFYASPLKNYLKQNVSESNQDQDYSWFKKSYVTTAALNDSFKVMFVNWFGKPQHTYLENGDHVYEKPKRGQSIPVTQFDYTNFEMNQTRVDYLKTIDQLVKEHGIRLVVITSPLSYEHLLRIDQDPHLKIQFEKYKDALTDIFDEVYDVNDLEIMSHYNSSEYYLDSNHPSFEFSRTILQAVFGKDLELAKLYKKRNKRKVVGL